MGATGGNAIEYKDGKTIRVTVADNAAGRNGTIVFTSTDGRMSVSVDITQKVAADYLTVSSVSLDEFPYGGGTLTLTLSSNANWRVDYFQLNGSTPIPSPWFSLSSRTGTAGDDQTLTLTVIENDETTFRGGVIRFIQTSGSASAVQINVIQAPAPNVDINNLKAFTSGHEAFYPTGETGNFSLTAEAAWRVKSVVCPENVTVNLSVGETGTAKNISVNATTAIHDDPLPVTIVFECTEPNTGYIGGDVIEVDGTYKMSNTFTVYFSVGPYAAVPTHNGWAGSNIYYDGEKLTFDLEPSAKQGVFFRFGALVGSYYYSTSDCAIYNPKGITNPGSYENIAYLQQDASDYYGDMTRHFVLEMHDPANGVGDVCHYISMLGNAPDKGRWRMPTAAEYEELISLPYTVTGTWSNSKYDLDQPDGTKIMPYIEFADNGVILPASGKQFAPIVTNSNSITINYMSASPTARTEMYGIWKAYSTGTLGRHDNYRSNTSAIRCVRE